MIDPKILLPIFVSGLAIQRALEIADAVRDWRHRIKDLVLFLSSVLLAFLTLWGVGPENRVNWLILKTFGVVTGKPFVVDYAVTILVMSAGTEGVNSIIKFLGYKKDEVRARTVDSLTDVKPL